MLSINWRHWPVVCVVYYFIALGNVKGNLFPLFSFGMVFFLLQCVFKTPLPEGVTEGTLFLFDERKTTPSKMHSYLFLNFCKGYSSEADDDNGAFSSGTVSSPRRSRQQIHKIKLVVTSGEIHSKIVQNNQLVFCLSLRYPETLSTCRVTLVV